jgi:hypothetical protein
VSLKQLALRDDQLWVTLAARKQALVAAVMDEQQLAEDGEDLVAAIKGKFYNRARPKKQLWRTGSPPPPILQPPRTAVRVAARRR